MKELAWHLTVRQSGGAHVTGRPQPQPLPAGSVSGCFYDSRHRFTGSYELPLAGWCFSSPFQWLPWTVALSHPCLDSSHPGASRNPPRTPHLRGHPGTRPGPLASGDIREPTLAAPPILRALFLQGGSCPLSGFCPAPSLSPVFISVQPFVPSGMATPDSAVQSK